MDFYNTTVLDTFGYEWVQQQQKRTNHFFWYSEFEDFFLFKAINNLFIDVVVDTSGKVEVNNNL